MSELKVNPFFPGAPVPPGIFAGRAKELIQIYRCVASAHAGQPQHLIILGERGIGKTSIAHFTKALAETKIPWPEQTDFSINPMITVYVSVQSKTPSVIVVKDIIEEIDQKISSYKWAKDLFGNFLSTFSELKIAGTGFKLKDRTEVSAQSIYSEAQKSLRKLADQCNSNYIQGKPHLICLILDELDRMDDFEGFSSFWKTLFEKLSADNLRNIMLVCVGMPELLTKLGEDHPSFLRVFTPLNLGKMQDQEAVQIIEKALEKSHPPKAIDPEALKKILYYSENYPHLIQEIGYSAFEVSKSKVITVQDIDDGLHGNAVYMGSIKRLGELFFNKMYDEVRKTDSYKEILRLIAEKSGEENEWVSRQQLVGLYSKGKTSLDSCLQKLVLKELIVRNPDQQGEYKLVSKMFHVYVSKILQMSSAD